MSCHRARAPAALAVDACSAAGLAAPGTDSEPADHRGTVEAAADRLVLGIPVTGAR